jgi:hypothetical protein
MSWTCQCLAESRPGFCHLGALEQEESDNRFLEWCFCAPLVSFAISPYVGQQPGTEITCFSNTGVRVRLTTVARTTFRVARCKIFTKRAARDLYQHKSAWSDVENVE